ncbi:MAG: Asp-tRNA(Asn)/Glu-tRNA(Gln) amidotransferase subunit GatC [Ferruginibacter sp.]
MIVNEALVDKLAKLSRLSFDQEEKKAIQQDLEKMISFVEKLQEVNTSGIAALTHMAVNENVTRKDEVEESISVENALKNAANAENGFFRVPKVIKK